MVNARKIIRRLVWTIILLIVVAALVLHFSLDGLIKRGVETFGPKFAGVNIKIDSVNLYLLTGSGTVKGLVVANPEGFKTPSAIQVGSTSVSLRTASLLSDKIVIHSIKLLGPQVTFETDLRKNNLSKLLDNVQAATGGGQEANTNQPSAKPSKKLQVDDFLLQGGKVLVSVSTMGGASGSVALPEVHLTNLGTGPDGITPAELTKEVLAAIQKSAAQAASGVVADLAKGGIYIGKDAGNVIGSNNVDKATKGLNDLFKKK
jgi:uncharacterized protein involved in outer membrane biogenesis